MKTIQASRSRSGKLNKVFGERSANLALQLVLDGMGKASFLKSTNHVLGLNDINCRYPGGQNHGHNGPFWSGKSTLIATLKPGLIEPRRGEVLGR